jgi:hypothetical protein
MLFSKAESDGWMNQQEFRKWLLSEYRPLIEQPNDERGGYLIPHFITADKAGRLAAFYRSVGRFLKSPRVYELGTYQFDMYAAIMAKAQKAGRE